ncbi:AraC family transcriptional regulator [Marinobacterium stanieri]|uniref:AraC family transcriptional regulator n=1 Tax=Marinobacterium stanieri TaxID=49186 RepID=UPI0009DA127E|nr:AraC family transcriptional regulator [Marinobacterium stanieri]
MHATHLRRNLIARSSGEHSHSFPQLLLGWRGETHCEFQSGGLGVGPGDVAVVPGDEAHYFAGRQDFSEMLVIDLNLEDPGLDLLCPQGSESLCEQMFHQPGFLSLSPDVRALTEYAAGQLSGLPSTSPQYDLLSRQWAMMLLAQIRSMCQARPDQEPVSSPIGSAGPASLDRFIDSRLASPPSNDELAVVFNMSRSCFHEWCRREFAKTPQQYLMDRRMKWAEYWLSQGSKLIGAVALDLGFADTASFTRAFRRHSGCSPSEFRARFVKV